MKCIVTGVAGFVGSSLAEKLLEDQSNEVYGIDCFTDYYSRNLKEANLEELRDNSRFSFLEADLRDPAISKFIDGANYIFHQAAQAGVRASWGQSFTSYTKCNIEATQCLLEFAKNSSTLSSFVYASSSSVYGSAETLPTPEDTLPAPVSPYGVTKLAAEHLCELYRKEFAVPTKSLRYFTVFGPRQRPDMAFNRFCRKALRGDEITIFGDGEQSRDFTFISDIVQANILAAKYSGDASVFNVGGGHRVTVNEVLGIISELAGKKLDIGYQERQKGDAAHTASDCTLANNELGYKPAVSLKEGLERELQWVEKNLELLPR